MFTVLLAGIAMVGVLSVASYNVLTGPIATMAKSNLHLRATNDMNALSKIIMRHAGTLAAGGDCDGDGYVEPVEYAAPATGNRFVPTNIGAPVTDPWGTRYMYCPFDLGTTGDAACNRDGVAGNQHYAGSPTPLAGNESSRYAFAVITAGPDRIYQTTCADYVNSTTATVTPGGDDMVQAFTYEQAAAAVPEYWSLTASAAETSKAVVEVQDAGGDATVSLAASTGIGTFGAVTTTGLVTAPGGIQVGTSDDVQTCSAGDEGLVRYNLGGTGSSGGGPSEPEILQKTSVQNSAGNVASANVNMPSAPAVGSTIIVSAAAYGDLAANSVTDNRGNTYTRGLYRSNGSNAIAVYYGRVTTTGTPFTITLDPPGSAYLMWGAMEVANIADTSPVDFQSTSAGTGGAANYTTPSGNATEDGIAFAVYHCDTFDGSVLNPFTAGAGWTQELHSTVTNNVSFSTASIPTTGGNSYSNTWTYAANGCAYPMGGIIGFKPAPASGDEDAAPVVEKVSTGYTGTASPATTSFSTPPAAGNAIIVMHSYWGTSNPVITDNYGNTYTRVANMQQGGASYSDIHVATNINTGPGFTVTATYSGGGPETGGLQALEVSGMPATGYLDQTGTAGASATGQTGMTVTTSGATSSGNQLAVAVHNGGFDHVNLDYGVSAGWTETFNSENCGPQSCASLVYKEITSAGTVSHTWTHAANSASWIDASAVIATFKGSSGTSGSGGGGSCAATVSDVTSGLIHRWKLDETSGTTANDNAGSNDGSFAGPVTPTWEPCLDGNCIHTAGDNSSATAGYINAGNVSGIANVSQLTMSAWFKRDRADETIVIGKISTTTNSLAIYAWGDGKAGCNVGSGTGENYFDTPAPGLGWYHVVMVYDGTQTGNANRLKCYVNGKLGTGTYTGTIPATTPNTSANFLIGAYAQSPMKSGDGYIEDVRIYDRPLSADEVAAIYNAMPRPTCTTAECGGNTAKRVVFTTSWNDNGGGRGGVAGADAACQSTAFAAGLSGTYKAWIADSNATSAPAARFEQSTVPYVKVDGTVVADNWADLTDGTLDSAINLSETGTSFGGTFYVSTNVNPDGTQDSATNHCSNWTSGSGTVRLGRLNQSGSTWSDDTGNCSWGQYLYCFEQPGTESAGIATVVQKTALASTDNATSLNASFTSLPQAGNTVIVLVVVGESGTGGGGQLPLNGVTDNQGNTYTRVAASSVTNDYHSNVYIYAAQDIAAPGGTFTVTANTAAAQGDQYIVLGAMEVSGLAEVDATGATAGATYGANGSVSTTGATTEANEFAVAILASDGIVITGVSSGWTEEYLDNTNHVAATSVVTKTVSAPGAVSHQWTHADSYNKGAIATFKIASPSSTGCASTGLQVCNGTQWVDVGNGSGSGSATTNEFWEDLAGTPAAGIYYDGGNVMVGTDTDVSSYLFNVTGDAAREGVNLYSYSGTHAPQVTFRRSRGTEASPSAIANLDYLGSMEFYSRIGGSWVRSGWFAGEARGTLSGNIIPSALWFDALSTSHPNPSSAFLMNTGANRMQPMVVLGWDGNTMSSSYVIHSKAADNGLNLISSSGVPEILLRRARGNALSPAANNSGDVLGALYFNGYDSNSWNAYTPGIGVDVTGSVSTSSLPVHLYLYPGYVTAPDGLWGLHFLSSGHVGWGNISYDQQFQMQGSINISDDASPDTIPTNLVMPAGGSLVLHGGKGAVKGGYRDGPWTLNEADIGTASFAFGGDGSRPYQKSVSDYVIQHTSNWRASEGTLTVSLPQPVTPGNSVLIFVQGMYGVSPFALSAPPTDNYGNTYDLHYSTPDYDELKVHVYGAHGVMSGSSTFTITVNTTSATNAYGYTATVVEVANLASSSLVAAGDTYIPPSSTSTSVTTGNAGVTDSIGFTFVGVDSNTSSFTLHSSWTELESHPSGTISPYMWDAGINLSYKVRNTNGNFNHTVTHNSINYSGNAVVIAFPLDPTPAYTPPENLLAGHATDDGTYDVMIGIYSDETVATATGTAVSMVVEVDNGADQPVRVGVYDASDSLIGQGTGFLYDGPGVYDIAFDAPVPIVSGQTYRLAIQMDEYVGMYTDTSAGTEWHCWMAVSYAAGLPANFDCHGDDFGGTLNMWLRSSSGSGLGARATANTAFAFGQDALASGSPSVAMGYKTEATAANAIAMGYGAKVSGVESIAVGGQNNRIEGSKSIAVAGGGSGAPAVVQQINMRFDAHEGISHGNMSPASFTTAPAVGNGIVVVVMMTHYMGQPSEPTITDNYGNTYTRIAVSPDITEWDVHWHPQIFHAPVTATGAPFTITLTPGASGYVETWMAFEVNGMDNASPLDGVAYFPGEPAGGSLTLTSASDMTSDNGLGIGIHRCFGTADNYSLSSGWTRHGYLNGNGSDDPGGVEHTISYISGPTEGGQKLSHRWSFTPASCNVHMALVANLRGVTLEAGGHNIDADRAVAFGGPIDMTAAADYSVGINLGPARVTMNTPNVFSVMGGKVGLGTVTPCAGAPGNDCALHVVGDTGLSTGTQWSNVSDIRLKDVHGPYGKGLADILQLQPVLFNYKKDNPYGNPSDRTLAGFTAQDVMKVFPEAVHQGGDGYYTLNMTSINVALVNAIRELAKENDAMDKAKTAMDKTAAGTARDLAALEKDIARMEQAAAGGSPLATLGMAVPAGLLLLFIGLALRRRREHG